MAGFMGKFKSILKQPEEDVEYDDFYDQTETSEDSQQDSTSHGTALLYRHC